MAINKNLIGELLQGRGDGETLKATIKESLWDIEQALAESRRYCEEKRAEVMVYEKMIRQLKETEAA